MREMRRAQCPGVLTSGHIDNHHQTINLHSWKKSYRSFRLDGTNTKAYRSQRNNANEYNRPIFMILPIFLETHGPLSTYIFSPLLMVGMSREKNLPETNSSASEKIYG